MPVSAYLPHALYSVAITSITIHLINHRTRASDERASAQARISVLESVVQQLRSDHPASDHELEKLKRLARPRDAPADPSNESMAWKEVILGRKISTSPSEMSPWEQKDMEQLMQELKE